MFQTLRKKMFWSVDSLRGGKLKEHYEDIKFIMDNTMSNEAQLRIASKLKNILEHASNTTSFYQHYKNMKLEEFPLINKNTIRPSYDDFISSKFKHKKNYAAYTSGSTGTPFKLLHDKNKRLRNSADVIYFAQQAGFEIGHKLYYIRHWDQYNSSHPLVSRMKNIHTHPVSKLSHDDVKKLLEHMAEDSSTKGIMCYASVLDEIAKYVNSTDDAPVISNIESIIAISESLKDEVKLTLEKYFGIPIISRYSNVENGIFAQRFKNRSEFQINWASYHVEILKLENNAPVEKGELGRIVITDLYNYCMPMIRYDTGDLGSIGYITKNGKKHKVLERIEGRKLDMIYDTSGKMISPFTVYHILKYPHIIQYQFIQEHKINYKIKLNVAPQFNSAKEISKEFLEYLGKDAKIELEYVEDIPLLSSGKRKFVVNNYMKTR